jgi:hypothetical protein
MTGSVATLCCGGVAAQAGGIGSPARARAHSIGAMQRCIEEGHVAAEHRQ